MICRQLGFPRGAIRATNSSYFGPVPDEFSYECVDCTGGETDIMFCYYLDWEGCEVNNGAGVVCNTEIPPAGKQLEIKC